MTEAERAYLAGFFDGEGSIHLGVHVVGRDRNRTHVLVVSAAQNDRRPLELLKANAGGSIQPKGPGQRCFQWMASGLAAERFLRAIAHLLIVKREQADLALQYRETIDARRKPTPPEVWAERERLKLAIGAARA